MIRLSVLDQSATSAGRSHQATLQNAIALAQHCERLGYHRYWIGEHHSNPTNVGPAPEILCAAVAAVTDRIRVGSAATLLTHYAPLKVAETFRVLSAIAPGRIDLGIGRAPGGAPAFVAAMNRGVPERNHNDSVDELLQWLEYNGAAPSSDDDVQAYPRDVDGPVPWMLGSTLRGAKHAARLGLPFCFNFSNSASYGLSREAIETYRAEFRPSRELAHPLASLSIWTIAAETSEEADRLFSPRAYWRAMLARGIRVPIVDPEQTHEAIYSEDEQACIDDMRRYSLVGSASEVAKRLQSIAEEHAIDELVLLTSAYNAADQFKSYELIARALDLRAYRS
ncbi:LLM class flavin-dependent oxidoreductase [Hyphomicrobium sp. LHD-15]|uniref:LLM class flavin-dependent oxidoreductase n=1 Tax=Hyphomicrobium sp. LHD-15 TaxID=3072142 RepID=UPI00280F1580|nr:LLM class flavin-dependent oxidoreductase [Hyphomicrobium sp. LHD-15]MDQ8700609.1 LLM class flavin-dependent oxidoreductase [Hyphomicrobium sp. LHD-15]